MTCGPYLVPQAGVLACYNTFTYVRWHRQVYVHPARMDGSY